MDEDLRAITQLKYIAIPAIFINGEEYLGKLKISEITSVICNNFVNKPEVCDNIKIEYKPIKNHIYMLIIVILAWGIAICAIICLLVAKKQAEKEVAEEVNRKVTKYFNVPSDYQTKSTPKNVLLGYETNSTTRNGPLIN